MWRLEFIPTFVAPPHKRGTLTQPQQHPVSLKHATMEPVGLAVGLLGLAGLFSSCLEAVDKVQDYRSYEVESQALSAQLKAERLRLEHWGEEVGFHQGQLLANHHPRLENPHISSAVKDLLLLIKRVCESEEASQRFSAAGGGSGHEDSSPAIEAQPSRSAPSRWKRSRVAWALRGKRERKEEVKHFGDIVQLLHNLVPPTNEKAAVGLNGSSGKDNDVPVPTQGEPYMAIYSLPPRMPLTDSQDLAQTEGCSLMSFGS
jgi:hypothetical protein